MKLKVRYFSVIKDATGRDSEAVEVQTGTTVSELYEKLTDMHPDLKGLDELLILVNGKPVPENDR